MDTAIGATPSRGSNDLPSRERTWCVPWLTMILVLAVALRLIFMVGPVASDDTRYMNAAVKLANGEAAQVVDHAYVRAVFIAWLALWVRLGAGVWGLTLSNVVLSSAVVWAVFWLGTRLADRRAALLAALCWAFFPVELLCGGIVVPDHLALLLALLSAGFACDGLVADAHKGPGRLVAAGALAGLAVSAKEPYALLPLIFGLWALWRVRPLKTAIVRSVALGAIAVAFFAIEYPFFRIWTGDWLYRHKALAAAYGAGGRAEAEPASAVNNLIYYLAQVLANPYTFGLIGWLLVIAAIRSLRRVREPAFIVIWSACFFLFLQYGSADLKHYQPMPKQWRYVQPMVVLLFVPLGRWLAEASAASALGRVGTALLVAGVGVNAVLSANKRAAEGFCFEGMPRCVAEVRSMQAAGQCGRVAIPSYVANNLVLDQRRATADWSRFPLMGSLGLEEVERLRQRHTAVLLPSLDWWPLHSANDYRRLQQGLLCQADSRPVLYWRSPIDRVIGLIPPIRSAAQKVEIGRLYVLK